MKEENWVSAAARQPQQCTWTTWVSSGIVLGLAKREALGGLRSGLGVIW